MTVTNIKRSGPRAGIAASEVAASGLRGLGRTTGYETSPEELALLDDTSRSVVPDSGKNGIGLARR